MDKERRKVGMEPTCDTYTVLTMVGVVGDNVGTAVIVGVEVVGVLVGADVNVGADEGANVGAGVGAPVGTSTSGACTTAAGMVATKLVFTALSVEGFANKESIAAADTVGE